MQGPARRERNNEHTPTHSHPLSATATAATHITVQTAEETTAHLLLIADWTKPATSASTRRQKKENGKNKDSTSSEGCALLTGVVRELQTTSRVSIGTPLGLWQQRTPFCLHFYPAWVCRFVSFLPFFFWSPLSLELLLLLLPLLVLSSPLSLSLSFLFPSSPAWFFPPYSTILRNLQLFVVSLFLQLCLFCSVLAFFGLLLFCLCILSFSYFAQPSVFCITSSYTHHEFTTAHDSYDIEERRNASRRTDRPSSTFQHFQPLGRQPSQLLRVNNQHRQFSVFFATPSHFTRDREILPCIFPWPHFSLRFQKFLLIPLPLSRVNIALHSALCTLAFFSLRLAAARFLLTSRR